MIRNIFWIFCCIWR